jgi:hypothetical protein
VNNVVIDWLDLTVILSTITACAVVGWFGSRRMNRFEAIKQIEPVAPVVDVQQIEVSVVDRGWRQWRRIARTDADRFQGPSNRKILFLDKSSGV